MGLGSGTHARAWGKKRLLTLLSQHPLHPHRQATGEHAGPLHEGSGGEGSRGWYSLQTAAKEVFAGALLQILQALADVGLADFRQVVWRLQGQRTVLQA